MILLPIDTSREDTTRMKAAYLAQLGIDAKPGSRAWVHRALELRVVESAKDVSLVNRIWRTRHYLTGQPAGPRMKRLSYLGDLRGCDPGQAGAAVAVTVALQPSNALPMQSIRAALDLHPSSIVELVRSWRADDLDPDVAPDLMTETLRRVVHGGPHAPTCSATRSLPCDCPRRLIVRQRGTVVPHAPDCHRGQHLPCDCDRVKPLSAEWNARKLTGGLEAPARVLITYADPAPDVRHDGGLYLGAGAIAIGRTRNGKRAFAWALDTTLKEPLEAYGRASAERAT